MRLIDADDLINNLVNACNDDQSIFFPVWIEKQIDAQPTIDADVLLKEQEAFQWINVKDKLPEKDGQYLVVYTFFDYRSMGVVRFSHNLHEIDEYIFDTENRPGWYEPDNEVGYFERTTVTHWAKLPEFPKEGDDPDE